MERLTDLQVSEQAARFEYFLQTGNLIKIAETYMRLNSFESCTYIRRVLRQCAGVGSSYYHPKQQYSAFKKFYAELLVINALSALINKHTKSITF